MIIIKHKSNKVCKVFKVCKVYKVLMHLLVISTFDLHLSTYLPDLLHQQYISKIVGTNIFSDLACINNRNEA